MSCVVPPTDLLKLSEETELDILNFSMEIMVRRYHTELLPVAVQLAARLVREKRNTSS